MVGLSSQLISSKKQPWNGKECGKEISYSRAHLDVVDVVELQWYHPAPYISLIAMLFLCLGIQLYLLRNVSSIVVQILLEINRQSIARDGLSAAKIADGLSKVTLIAWRCSHISQGHL